jgi:hypothetical protein
MNKIKRSANPYKTNSNMTKIISLNDFLTGNKKNNLLSQIFHGPIPETKIWSDPIEILLVLQSLAGSHPYHSAFLPGGGHIHLQDVKMPLQGHIDLIDAFPYRIRPKQLTFSNLSNNNYYFLLESHTSKPTGLGIGLGMPPAFETVAEAETGKYIHRDFHDYYDSYEHNYGVYQEMYSVRPRLVKLYFRGLFLIVNNSNPYNRASFASSDRHSELTPTELKTIMQLFSDELSDVSTQKC